MRPDAQRRLSLAALGQPCRRFFLSIARVEGGAEPVRLCGLGAMALPIAERLLAQGHRRTVWNRTAGRAAVLVTPGGARATLRVN